MCVRTQVRDLFNRRPDSIDTYMEICVAYRGGLVQDSEWIQSAYSAVSVVP